MPGFQTAINLYQAPGLEGDFASADPYATTLAGEGALIAGPAGVTIGTFAFVAAGVASNAGAGVAAGFVGRPSNIALITAWLGQSSMLIPPGREMTLFSRGCFWVRSLTAAAPGNAVFASNTTGQISTGAPGATIAGSTELPNWRVGPLAAGGTGAIGELIKITTWG